MISAGTISAYLVLETSQFNRSIGEAIKALTNLCATGTGSSAVLGGMGTAIGTAAGVLHSQLTTAANESAAAVGYAAGSYAASIAAASLGVANSISAMKSNIKSLGSVTEEASRQSKVTAEAIKAPFSGLGKSLYGVMTEAGNGMIRGLSSKKSSIMATAKGIADSVAKTIRSALRIASPSRVMRTIGEQTAQGLVIGLDSMLPGVESSASALARTISGAQYQSATAGASVKGDQSFIAERLDQLIALLSGGEQVMQVDGRAFARLIREYS